MNPHQGWAPPPRGVRKKIFLAAIGALGVAIASVVGVVIKNKVGARKGTIRYGALGIDNENAHVDKVVDALLRHAKKRWRRDATWWSLNIHGVRPDGTVDLTADRGGGATIKFVSGRRVQAASKRGRRDSIKEYSLTRRGVRSNKIISARKPWKGFKPLPMPQCTIAALVAEMGRRGFSSGMVRISFDPKFGFASGWNWRVYAEGKPYAGYYNMDTCAFSPRPPSKS